MWRQYVPAINYGTPLAWVYKNVCNITVKSTSPGLSDNTITIELTKPIAGISSEASNSAQFSNLRVKPDRHPVLYLSKLSAELTLTQPFSYWEMTSAFHQCRKTAQVDTIFHTKLYLTDQRDPYIFY